MDQKKICPNCQGNGFVKVYRAANPANDTVMQCTICNSKGEVHDKEFDEYFDSNPLLKSLQPKLN
jgi:DnaJ-class molecular chaperone